MQRTANLMIEQRLLGNILIQPEVWHEIATDFRPELFSDSSYRTIAQIIVDLTGGGKRPSSVRVYKEMAKRDVGLTTDDLIKVVTGHVTAKETRALLSELDDLWKRRTIYQTLANAINNLQQEDKPTDELIAEAQQAMIDAFNKTGKGDLKSMQDVCEALFTRQELIQNGQAPPVYPLNLVGVQTLVGGFELGSLNIIAARPSMGKTAYVLHECLGWAQKGLPGVIFSLEQKDLQIAQRMIANQVGVPVSNLRNRLDEQGMDKFYTGLSKLRDLPIKISDKRGLTADQICSIARLEKMRTPDLKWIVVDYLTALSFDPRQSQYLAVGDAALKLRNLAEEIDIFVVLISQLNRGVETRSDKRPVKADLRDSGNLEEYADSILFLYREGYYNPNFLGCPEGDWITEIEVAKNRQGGNDGKRTLVLFEQPYMRWSVCPSGLAEQYERAVQKRRKKEGK